MDRLTGVIPKLDAGVTPRELLEEEYMQNPPEGANEENVPSGVEIAAAAGLAAGGADAEAAGVETEGQEQPEADAPSDEAKEDAAVTPETEETPEAEAKETEQTPAKSIRDNAKPIEEITDEQKAIFSYFMPIKGMEEQIRDALSGISKRLVEHGTAITANLIIQGGQGSGKTTLATSIIKVIQNETGYLTGKVAKIKAAQLNKKDLGDILSKVEGGCLIIEQAGALSRAMQVSMSLRLDREDSGVLIILEDTSKGIRKLMQQDERFARMFSEKITVPIFTNDELVNFAHSYAKEHGYKIDELAVLALYNRISKIERLDQATTLTEIKDIVDEAIKREANGGIKKAFSILTASRYTDDDRIVLREKDFE
jgi:hypothetical protein